MTFSLQRDCKNKPFRVYFKRSTNDILAQLDRAIAPYAISRPFNSSMDQ
jgi:hypothetical protein